VSSSPTSTTVEVTMPQMGVSVAEGTIVAWKKQVGDWIERDEPIVEISTDKVETEVPSPAAGRVSEILVDMGVTVDVGTVLARIDGGAQPGQAHAAEEAEPAETAEPAESSVVSRQPEEGRGQRAEGNGDAPVTPVVRRIAAEHNIDLSQVQGSGRRGRVTKKDVMAFLRERDGEAPTSAQEPVPSAQEVKAEAALHIESPYREEAPAPPPPPPAAAPAPAPAPEPAPAAAATGGELSLMRKQIGEHMVRSLQTAAHCTTIVEADMSAIDRARKSRREKLTYLPFVAKAAIDTLREFPQLNATLEGERYTIHDEINLGIAVSLGENGLIVPVVKNAHELSHEGLAARIKDLAERARSKKLVPDEVSGGTFTITNPGAFGALLATPIINQPQVAILDLEAVVKRPVVIDDAIAIRPMTYFCMSWDHRALDGALAAQFLSALRRRVEAW
jgi:pyruvate/2-oxoglutarate dehydrogenase complex dihydrolipoamide acyltransferase (E2) component